MEIQIKNQVVLFDDESLANHKWYLDSHGYACTRIDGKRVYMHHLIIGKGENGLVVDHINRNRLDNRESNLRHVTRAVNNQNNSTKGYWFEKSRSKWHVEVMINGKRHRKRVDTEEEAIRLVDDLRRGV